MKSTYLQLQRTRNASVKNGIINRDTVSNFGTPLWKAGAGVGAGLGVIKGGLEQDPSGRQIDPGERLMNVGLNAAGGATLLGAAGAGIPQLLRENTTAKDAAVNLYNKTGIAVDTDQVMGTADRIRLRRKQKQGILKPIQKALDPITGRLEILKEDIMERTPIGTVIRDQQVKAARREAMKAAVRQRIDQGTTALVEKGIDAFSESPELVSRIKSVAATRAEPILNSILDVRTPVEKGVQAISDSVQGIKEVPGLLKRTVGRARKALRFSYMGTDTYFSKYNPYTTGATIGGISGAVIGGGLGYGQGVIDADDQEDKQVEAIDSISDPYARQKEWELYDNDLSRTGRAVGKATSITGSTLGKGTLGLAGGALLGGAGLTAYHNLKNNPFQFGNDKPTRSRALRYFITGR